MITGNGKPHVETRAAVSSSCPVPLHHLGVVREREGISRRSVARRLGITESDVARQEHETTDIRLSELYRWRDVLNVPLAELLIESDGSLSPPVMFRAQLVRIMKTVASIRRRAKRAPIRRLAQMLDEQLTKIMPELREVQAWPTKGPRCTADRTAPDSFSDEPNGNPQDAGRTVNCS